MFIENLETYVADELKSYKDDTDDLDRSDDMLLVAIFCIIFAIVIFGVISFVHLFG